MIRRKHQKVYLLFGLEEYIPLKLRKIILKLIVVAYLIIVLLAFFNGRERIRYTMLDEVFEIGSSKVRDFDTVDGKRMCRAHWDDLQLQHVDVITEPCMDDVIERNKMVETGGSWSPTYCTPLQRVGIVIAYRNRYSHLKILLNRLHPMLRRQKISYRIFLIEQAGEEDFNRGILMNIGFHEALKHEKFDCFIFHDVDLVPEHDRNIYLCDNHVRHLSSAIDEMRYHVIYYHNLGGVTALNTQNILKINGYSNIYWGWGQEDDDLSARTAHADMLLTRPPENIGRYKMIRHQKSAASDSGASIFMRWRERWKEDGLNTLEGQYKLVSWENKQLYTHITVDLGKAPSLEDVLRMTSKYKSESLLWYLWFYIP